jgi:hypothetical protein
MDVSCFADIPCVGASLDPISPLFGALAGLLH